MKQLKEIVFKSLVDNLGVDPALLSRVEADQPITIELTGGEDIYVYFQGNTLQTYIEIPFKDRRVLPLKASKFMEALANNEQFFMNVQKDKVIVFAELGEDIMHLEQKLSGTLDKFNTLAHQFRI